MGEVPLCQARPRRRPGTAPPPRTLPPRHIRTLPVASAPHHQRLRSTLAAQTETRVTQDTLPPRQHTSSRPITGVGHGSLEGCHAMSAPCLSAPRDNTAPCHPNPEATQGSCEKTCKAHILLYHSTLGLRVKKKKKRVEGLAEETGREHVDGRGQLSARSLCLRRQPRSLYTYIYI